MTEHEKAEITQLANKIFCVRLTPNQLRFLIHVLRAYSNLRFDMEIRHQTELNFLRDEFLKGGGYPVLKMYKQALEDSQDFGF